MPPCVAPTRAPSRRTLLAGTAWAVPAVALAAPAPALAASLPCSLALITQDLGSSGPPVVALYLRDKKTSNNNTNVDPTNQTVVNLKVQLSCGSVPAGTTIEFVGDEVQDGQGNYMIGASPPSTTGNITAGSTKRTAAVLADASGYATAKISTSTYSVADCGSIPRSGILTITAKDGSGQVLATLTLTYTVYDGPSTVNCP